MQLRLGLSGEMILVCSMRSYLPLMASGGRTLLEKRIHKFGFQQFFHLLLVLTHAVLSGLLKLKLCCDVYHGFKIPASRLHVRVGVLTTACQKSMTLK